jgi:hypothetical protein
LGLAGKRINHGRSRHLNSLGGREKFKYEHLGKTKDLAAAHLKQWLKPKLKQ